MLENIVSTLKLFAAFATGLAVVPEPSALGVAVAVLAAVVLVVAFAVTLPVGSARSGPHPRRAIDLSAPLAQSDPDAAGHARPRAPGIAASAA